MQSNINDDGQEELPKLNDHQDQQYKMEGQKGQSDENNLIELENLSREELIKLVRKQMMLSQNEAQKQLMAVVEEEAEESAITEQQREANLEIALKMGEVKMACLASQQRVEELTAEMAKLHVEHQKQSEEFSKRIAKLQQEKEEDSQHELNNMPEQSAEKLDVVSIKRRMKIQLAKETWYDWLGFVSRNQLGKIVPQIGDRRFASIVQPFLHEYMKITIDRIQIVAPYDEDPSGPHPRVRAWHNDRPPLRFEMAEAQMPANITNFNNFELSYFDQSVPTFMQKFQQNGLLENVNLEFDKLSEKDILPTVLCHLLPLINDILSLYLHGIQLVDLYDAANSTEIYELNIKMMEKTRILGVSYDSKNLDANMIDLYCRWLYQLARADGKPRVLVLERLNVDSTPISLFIDRLKQDFLMAKNPITFRIQIILPKAFQLQENICLENVQTKERLLTKIEKAHPNLKKNNLCC